MPRVSVLLTCYNHMRYLPACVQGVFSQTYQNFEVISIDDGSNDGTREWLSACPRPLKLVFNESNLGTYASLNAGLRQATGEFVAILNDDDLWAPEKLAKQIALFEKHPKVGLVHTDGWFIDGEGRRMEGAPLGFAFPRTETGDILLDLMYANKIIASAAMVRRSCFDELGGFNESYFGSGDWEMWFRIAERYEVGFVAEPLTFYRVHGANASHKLERIWQDDEKLRLWIASRASSYSSRGYGPRLTKALAHNQACLGTVLTLNGKPAEGRRAYAASIRLDPTRIKSYVRWCCTFLPPRLFRKLL